MKATKPLRLIFDQELSDTIEGNSPNIKKQMSNSVPSQETMCGMQPILKYTVKPHVALRGCRVVSVLHCVHIQQKAQGDVEQKKLSESPSTFSGTEKNVVNRHVHVHRNRPSTAEGTVGQHGRNSLAAGYSARNFHREQKLLTEPEDLFEPAYFSSFDCVNQTLKTGDHVWIKVDVHGGAYVHTVASLGQFRGTNGLQQSDADVRAMKDVPFVLDGFVKGSLR